MRTTVEIRADQRLALNALAHQRGLRGISELVQEAIDLYLAQGSADDLDTVLSLRGILSLEEGDELERRIREAWSASSVES
jgi:hypothetical protein